MIEEKFTIGLDLEIDESKHTLEEITEVIEKLVKKGCVKAERRSQEG